MRVNVDKAMLAAIHAKAKALNVHLPDDATAVRWALCRGAGIGLMASPPAPPGVCQGCQEPRKHLGRFLDDRGVAWGQLCGGCKIRLTMTPKRKAALAADVARALSAPTGEVIETTGESVDQDAARQLPGKR